VQEWRKIAAVQSIWQQSSLLRDVQPVQGGQWQAVLVELLLCLDGVVIEAQWATPHHQAEHLLVVI
jgi:hypothetical protein